MRISILVMIVLALAFACLSWKGKRKGYSTRECKEIGYYIATDDAFMYYVWRCEDQKLSPDERLRCEGMSEMQVYLSREMRRRGDDLWGETICTERDR